jgi:hypothetical protein
MAARAQSLVVLLIFGLVSSPAIAQPSFTGLGRVLT